VFGVVAVGALADLLLVDGDPLTDLDLVATP
jgi:imidazolonepropionase-like amidohydrolase